MHESENSASAAPKRVPWNKGKLTGARPPLRPKHVWAVRIKLQMEKQIRDLALFNLAIDSKLRGCDVVAIDISPVAIQKARRLAAARGVEVEFELVDVRKWHWPQPNKINISNFTRHYLTLPAL